MRNFGAPSIIVGMGPGAMHPASPNCLSADPLIGRPERADPGLWPGVSASGCAWVARHRVAARRGHGVSVAGVRLRVVKSGRRFRVELTEVQVWVAQQSADACRVVWNTGLEQRREYRRGGAWMNYSEQDHELVEAKVEHPWLAEAPSHCLQQTLTRRAAGMERGRCGGAQRGGGCRRFGSRRAPRWSCASSTGARQR